MVREEIINILRNAMTVRVLNAEQRTAFETGLELIEKNPKALSFVNDARRFHDYHRRVRYLLTYLQTMEISDGEIIIKKRRTGRPTKAEQIDYAKKQRQKAIQDIKKSLFPEVKPDFTLQSLTYKGIVANPNGESIAASMPRLSDLKPFLSKQLQERINSVRDLRNEMAAKAEQAKTMAEANEQSLLLNKGLLYSEEEISELANRAVEIESHILPDIYTSVDEEMGECYLRLSSRTGDPEYIALIEKKFNVSPQDLRTKFKPFYEKAQGRNPRFAEIIAERIANDRPEVKAAREAAAKHKAEADAIIKYIIRKDKLPTKVRVNGLKERINRLRRDYSDIIPEDEFVGYEAILDKTIKESEDTHQ